MPFGNSKYQRLDPRRSSPYCSTTTIVVLVALCLVGVWMMTSSTVVPVDVPADSTNTELKQDITENDAKQFQDSNGDIPTDATKGDTNTVSNNIVEATSQVDSSTKESEASKQESVAEASKQESVATSENGAYSDASKQESVAEASKQESVATSENGAYSDANGKTEGGVTVKSDDKITKEAGESKSDNGNKNTGGKEDSTGKIMGNDEKISEQEKNSNTKSDQADSTEQGNTIEQNFAEKESNGQGYNTKQENKSSGDTAQEENVEKNKKDSEKDSQTKKPESHDANELLPSGAHSELLNETNTQSGAWSTQASQSKNEKEVQASSSPKVQVDSSSWKLCNVTAGPDYIPCLDNEEAIKKLKTTRHYEHRERHCPEDPPTCLVPLPEGYKKSIEWPASRDKIWYHNVPHTELAAVKGHQNWVKVSGEYLTFPGGGTQFIHGALHYIDVIQEALPDIAWGKRSRVVLDVGCGVASFGGYLFDRDVLTMSFAPKDEHEAQVQFALERGIPAISAVMGTKRLPYPARVFDVIHCARCRVPWHIEGGKLLLELNRLLRPGGYFVWSATPVYQDLEEDVEIWNEMAKLMKAMCWDMVAKTKDTVDKVGLAIFRKPSDNSCYEKRKETSPPFCQESDDPNAAWNVPLQTCMHKLPVDPEVRGSQWPENWPVRLSRPPYWLNSSQTGVYGKPAPEDFKADQEHWNTVVTKSYMSGMGIDWSRVRNIMDMRAVYGGFAAALKDMKVWVMNIVSIDSPDTLPIIYERGLFGMYHDWCESFSTYPRSYDLLHADHLFSRIKKKCKLLPLMVEVDRMLRPEGKLIVRDTVDVTSEVESIAKSLKWEIRMTFSKKNEGILCVMKTAWRPKELN